MTRTGGTELLSYVAVDEERVVHVVRKDVTDK